MEELWKTRLKVLISLGETCFEYSTRKMYTGEYGTAGGLFSLRSVFVKWLYAKKNYGIITEEWWIATGKEGNFHENWSPRADP